jgi:hypothetical protein
MQVAAELAPGGCISAQCRLGRREQAAAYGPSPGGDASPRRLRLLNRANLYLRMPSFAMTVL